MFTIAIHAVFFTQDSVMKRLLKEIELFSQQIPGRLTVDWQFGKGILFFLSISKLG